MSGRRPDKPLTEAQKARAARLAALYEYPFYKWLRENGLSLTDALEAMGVSYVGFNRWCRGTCAPKPEHMWVMEFMSEGAVTASALIEYFIARNPRRNPFYVQAKEPEK